MRREDYLTLPRPFCGVDGVDEDIHDNSQRLESELLVKNYKLVEVNNQDVVLAVVSLSNSSLSFSKDQAESKLLNRNKYPAVQIETLGVLQRVQKKGVGSIFLQLLKELFVEDNRTGCRFIVLDSLKGAMTFYEKNEFVELKGSRWLNFEELEYEDFGAHMVFNLLTDP